MNRIKYLVFTAIIAMSFSTLSAQSWQDQMVDKNATFDDITNSYYNSTRNSSYQKGQGMKQFERWQDFWKDRLMPDGRIPSGYKYFKSHWNESNTRANENGNWIAVGPFDHESTGSWSPGTGRVNVVTQDPNNENTLYVGAPVGGVWKSTDNGQNWSPICDQLSSIGISDIAINPNNSQEIYLGTGDRDGRDSYSIGVVKSMDGGQTWNMVGPEMRFISKVVIDPQNSNIVWVGSRDGLYKTEDAGLTWNRVSNKNVSDLKLKPNNPSHLYMVGNDELFTSTDAGASFQAVQGLPANVGRMAIATTPANANMIYALVAKGDNSFGGVYQSTNSGVSFFLKNSNTDIFNASTQAWYDMAIAVSETDPNTVVTGLINLWKSTDGGSTFNQTNSWNSPEQGSYTHADIHFLRYFGDKLFCGSDGGVYLSTNHATAFTDLSKGLCIGQFYRIAITNQDNSISGGLQDNGGYVMNNDVWKVYHGADGMETAIDPNNSDIVYGMIQRGELYQSSNGGNSVVSIGKPAEDGNWVTPMQMDPRGGRLVVGYDDLYEYIPASGWNKLSTFDFPDKINALRMYETNPDIMVISASDKLYRTTDKGANWTNITAGVNGNITSIEIHPTNSDVIWVTVSGFSQGNKIFKSTNAGTTWENISGSLPNLPTNIVKYDASNNGLYIGNDAGVYYSSANFIDWINFDNHLPNTIVRDIEINLTENIIQIATFGRGVWQSELYGVEVADIDMQLVSIVSPKTSICGSESNIELKVKNRGIQAITTFDIEYVIGNMTPQIFHWNGSISTGESQFVTIPNAVFSGGNIQLTITLRKPNGIVDETPENNMLSEPIAVDVDNTSVKFSLTTDCYPGETSWSIKNADDEVVLSAVGADLTSYNDYTYQMCLSQGCYILEIKDQFGDGLNGNSGNCNADGDFNLVVDGTVVFQMENPNFGESTSHNFCINTTNSLSWNNELADVTLACNESVDPAQTGQPVATTDCNDGATNVVYVDQVNGNTIVRTWTATNECDANITMTQNITIVDNQNPTITCAEDITINSNDESVFVTVPSPTANDDCGLAGVVNSFNASDNASGNYPVGNTVITWTASDNATNVSTCTQSVTVSLIVTTMSWNGTLEDVTVNCNESIDPAQTGQPTATTDCNDGATTVEYTDQNNGGEIIRTWVATNECSLEITMVQNINIVDNQPPTIICGGDITMNSSSGAIFVVVPSPTVNDDCGQAGFINSINNTDNASNEYPVGTSVITWTATDIGGNSTECLQSISVVEVVASLSWESTVTDIVALCDESSDPDVTGTPVATTDCDGGIAELSYADQLDGNQVVRTWTAIDACGSQVSFNQVIYIVDNQAPVMTCEDINVTYNGADMYIEVVAPITEDNCGLESVTNDANNTDNASGVYSLGTTTINWTAVDSQGNESTCQQIINIEEANGIATIGYNSSDMMVYPNPNDGSGFSIKLTNADLVNAALNISITDVTGRVVYYTSDVSLDYNLDYHVILDNNLRQGLYMVTISNESIRSTKKLIIEHK